MHHRMPPSKTVWSGLNVVIFCLCCSSSLTTQDSDTPMIIDQIHERISEGRRISSKSIAEQLGISHERVGSIIHEDLDMRKV